MMNDNGSGFYGNGFMIGKFFVSFGIDTQDSCGFALFIGKMLNTYGEKTVKIYGVSLQLGYGILTIGIMEDDY